MLSNANLCSPEFYTRFPRVSIVGLGDAGSSIVSSIFEQGGAGAQCIALSSCKESLDRMRAHEKVLIDPAITGQIREREGVQGRDSISASEARVVAPLLAGADVVFVAARMGEGNEVDAAPLIADVARRLGAVTVGIAMIPPPTGRENGLNARQVLAGMRQSCNTLAIVDTNLLAGSPTYPPSLSSDSQSGVVVDMISGLSETLACPSVVNIDFAPFRDLMVHGGIAHIGISHSSSALRVEEAAIGALRNPLLYDSVGRIRGAIVNLRGDSSLTFEEAERASGLIMERAGWDLPVIVGVRVNESWYQECQVSILLTGGVYPYIPGGHRRLPLDMYEMEPGTGEEEPIDLDLDLDQLEES